jgi:hypothetical protein
MIDWSLFCQEMSNTYQNIKSNEDVGANTDCSQTEGSGLSNCISHARQNNLPHKKRFENQNIPSYKEDKASSQQIQNQESKTEESKAVSILPGVIRHTSCPNNSLAYYYDYNVSSQ